MKGELTFRIQKLVAVFLENLDKITKIFILPLNF
jgi:hypothetical protein